MTAPGGATDGPSEEWLGCRARLQRFADALGPLAEEASLGRPFGEGAGVEFAVAEAHRCFADAADARRACTIVAVDILGATGSQIWPRDLDAVMGVGNPTRSPAQTDLAGAVTTYLGEFDDEAGPMWQLWSRRDDVAAEFRSTRSSRRYTVLAGRIPFAASSKASWPRWSRPSSGSR